jgi:hypothetical protein
MSVAMKLDQGVLFPVETLVRKRVVGRTENMKRLSKRELERGRLVAVSALREVEPEHRRRPETRAECLPGGRNAQRPCPYASCVHHLALDVNPRSGAIKQNFPDREVWELAETCALDVADRGGVTLEEVAALVNLTRERVRQLESRGLEAARGTREARLAAGIADVAVPPGEPQALREPREAAGAEGLVEFDAEASRVRAAFDHHADPLDALSLGEVAALWSAR